MHSIGHVFMATRTYVVVAGSDGDEGTSRKKPKGETATGGRARPDGVHRSTTSRPTDRDTGTGGSTNQFYIGNSFLPFTLQRWPSILVILIHCILTSLLHPYYILTPFASTSLSLLISFSQPRINNCSCLWWFSTC